MYSEDSINGWHINPDPYDRNNKRKGNEFRVNFCTSCNKAYEYYYLSGCGSRLIYHEDFPVYKIKRKVCRNCG